MFDFYEKCRLLYIRLEAYSKEYLTETMSAFDSTAASSTGVLLERLRQTGEQLLDVTRATTISDAADRIKRLEMALVAHHMHTVAMYALRDHNEAEIQKWMVANRGSQQQITAHLDQANKLLEDIVAEYNWQPLIDSLNLD